MEIFASDFATLTKLLKLLWQIASVCQARTRIVRVLYAHDCFKAKNSAGAFYQLSSGRIGRRRYRTFTCSEVEREFPPFSSRFRKCVCMVRIKFHASIPLVNFLCRRRRLWQEEVSVSRGKILCGCNSTVVVATGANTPSVYSATNARA